MPADRRRSRVAQARNASRPQTMVNHIGGGQGGSGGDGHGDGAGGAGGHGMGPSLSFDISVGHFTMHNNVLGNFDRVSGDPNRQNTVGGDPLHDLGSGLLIHQNIHQYRDRGIDIMHRSVALEAIHDSMDSFPQPRCHPETRTKMLGDLRGWALDTDSQTSVLWLYGPAGAGKSAIMRTLATRLHEDGRLGGCFFFKRGHATRGNAKTVITTIAYQLAIRVPWLKTPISRIIENDPSIVGQCITSQMQNLISGPCHSHEHRDPGAILIDGLDECEGHNFQQEILRAIRSTSSDHLISPRFIVASRPEPHIRELFNTPLYSGHYCSFNVEQSFHDVRKYLSDEFARIHREHDTMARIQSPWPSEYILEELVRKSSGYFIYASTIIKFIDDKNYRPTQQLAMVQDTTTTGSESAFNTLDQLYLTILTSAHRQSELIPILSVIVNFQLAPHNIDRLLGFEEGETWLRLRNLHSVLNMPSDMDIIRSHHASFLDFLDNPDRSGPFCVGTLQHQIDLARMILEAYAGTHENVVGFWARFLESQLISFLESSLPSAGGAELFPLIGTIDPNCVFFFRTTAIPERMLVWLKMRSAPRDLMKLWEDYEYMASFERKVEWNWHELSAGRMVPCSSELLRILVSLVAFTPATLSNTRDLLDLTWTEMRTSVCGASSNSAKDQHGLTVLAASLTFRDVALHCIRKMVKNTLNMGRHYSWETPAAVLESIRRTGRNQIGANALNKHKTEQWVS
ncbi:putative nwd2 protein [Mycena sanguinolenta]|uniref:Putative nwd2 protein n=1 Tax=Mycena sanguinolenta TaxID=230812 RepID=A0A8H6Z8M0_9AGAR|nr:putative nwd2 protein [Mycena sanguinolenta]